MKKEKIELFTAYSIIYGFHNRDNVCFSWFRQNRKRPIFTEGKSSREGGGKSRTYLDRLFTGAEIVKLREYLHQAHDTDLFVQKVSLPVKETALDTIPEGESPLTHGTGFYMLSKETGYSLPFSVWAYYDLTDSPLTHQARERQEERRAGVIFLRRALEKLGGPPGIDEEDLDAVVAELYEDSGFQVTFSAGRRMTGDKQ